jgi:hypothetical protein
MHRSPLLTIQSLADGVDPATGEVFASDSPYQRADIVRALYAASRALELEEARAQRRARLPRLTGVPWSDPEDARLREAFAVRKPAAEIGAAHDRTVTAIRARLVKLGLISAYERYE